MKKLILLTLSLIFLLTGTASAQESEIEPVIREIMEDSECGTIYRIKGTLPAADGTFLSVNAEKNRITLSPTVIGQAVLIVIGETLNREQIDTHLKAKYTDPEYVSI